MKKKILCMVLAVVMCLSFASVAMAAKGSPADGWIKYDPSSVPDGYTGYYGPNTEEDNALLNEYAANHYPGATLEEIGTVVFLNDAGDYYVGDTILYVEDASVSAGDKVTVLCMDMDGNIIAVEATAEDGGFVFTVPTPGAYSYFVVKATSDKTVTAAATTNTSAKSPKTGGEER